MIARRATPALAQAQFSFSFSFSIVLGSVRPYTPRPTLCSAYIRRYYVVYCFCARCPFCVITVPAMTPLTTRAFVFFFSIVMDLDVLI